VRCSRAQLIKGLIRFVLDFPVVGNKGMGVGVAWMQASAAGSKAERGSGNVEGGVVTCRGCR